MAAAMIDSEMMEYIEGAIDNSFWELPVRKIDDIGVICRIGYHRGFYSGYRLEIDAREWFAEGDELYRLHNSQLFELAEDVIEYTLKFLDDCVWDLFDGSLDTRMREESSMEPRFAAVFEHKRVKLSYEECPVCKDAITKTKTACGHTICIKCVSKLPCDDHYKRECPCCRQRFSKIIK